VTDFRHIGSTMGGRMGN